MNEHDILHVSAKELAESIADKLARLEPESAVLSDVNRLVQMLIELNRRERSS